MICISRVVVYSGLAGVRERLVYLTNGRGTAFPRTRRIESSASVGGEGAVTCSRLYEAIRNCQRRPSWISSAGRLTASTPRPNTCVEGAVADCAGVIERRAMASNLMPLRASACWRARYSPTSSTALQDERDDLRLFLRGDRAGIAGRHGDANPFEQVANGQRVPVVHELRPLRAGAGRRRRDLRGGIPNRPWRA